MLVTQRATQRVTTWPINPGRCNLNEIADEVYPLRIPRSVLNGPYVFEAYKRTNLDTGIWNPHSTGSHNGNEQPTAPADTITNVSQLNTTTNVSQLNTPINVSQLNTPINVSQLNTPTNVSQANTLRPEPTQSPHASQYFETNPHQEEFFSRDFNFNNGARLIGHVFDSHAIPSGSMSSLPSEHASLKDPHSRTGSPMMFPWSPQSVASARQAILNQAIQHFNQDSDVAHMMPAGSDTTTTHVTAGSQFGQSHNSTVHDSRAQTGPTFQPFPQPQGEEATSNEHPRAEKRLRTQSPLTDSNLSRQESEERSPDRKRARLLLEAEGQLTDSSEEEKEEEH